MIQKVLLSEASQDTGVDLLKSKGLEILVPAENSQEAFEAQLPEAEGIVLRTNVQMNAQAIAKAPGLKIMARTGAGVDNVDVEAATERGILVCNLVGINSVSVAEHALSFILSLGKQLPFYDKAMRDGEWQLRRSKAGMELEGKVLGVAGIGNIGARVAKMCYEGLGMKVLAFDPYAKEKFADYDYTFVDDLEALFSQADFVTLHLPSLPETKGVVNEQLLGVMKPTAYLINTARGDVIDEEALAGALREKQIAGAALDVYGEEPPAKDHPFVGLSNVILTPHVASLTKEVTVKASYGAAKAIVDYAEGRTPDFVYNRKELGL
jgi:D-3-phosphoglycerate dehydrogenase / 2-oxoglutarate reductase